MICIARSPGSRETMCGQNPGFEFMFLSPEHAAQESSLKPCDACLKVASGLPTQDGYDWPNHREAA